ncbi:MAG: sulfite exporter TauE/SafE family protein [Candidatus Planktophila sp.]
MLEFLLIAGVGLVVGVINGMAGGASVISFPVILATGLSPVSAAMTNAVGITPANFFALIAIRHRIKEIAREYAQLIWISITASILGAIALINMPPKVFEKIVPFLLLFATLSLLVKVKPKADKNVQVKENIGIAASGFYCGYFGPGQGVMVIAVLARDPRRQSSDLNSAKNLIVGCTSIVSNVIYIFSGLVHWTFVGALLLGSTLGGTLGGRWATRMSPSIYRGLVLITGLAASAWLFEKYLF